MFDGEEVISVASVSYNLAGDILKRPHYLKNTILGGVLFEKESMADVINNAYLKGPGIKLSSFSRWARNSYYASVIGLTSSEIGGGNSIDLSVLATYLPVGPGEVAQIQRAEIDVANAAKFADQFVAANYPERIDQAYAVGFDPDTMLVTVTFPDTFTDSFTATFNTSKLYMYVTYNTTTTGPVTGPVVPGSTVTLPPGDPLPDVTGWTENSLATTPHTESLDEVTDVVSTFSDGRPDETSTNTVTTGGSYTELHGEWERTDYIGIPPGSTAAQTLRQIMTQDQVGAVVTNTTTDTVVEDIGGGVMKTTTTTVTTQSIEVTRSYKIDTQTTTDQDWSPVKMFIYEFGSGNAVLDDMFDLKENFGNFFPYIPVRINNEFVAEDTHPAEYAISKKAYKRAFNARFDEMVDMVKENESLDDIDHVSVVFGVSLNVKENACRKYIYKFFQIAMQSSSEWHQTNNDYNTWKIQFMIAKASHEAYAAWRAAQSVPTDPLYGTPAPEVIMYPRMRPTWIKIQGPQWGLQGMMPLRPYDIAIWFDFAWEEVVLGLAKPDAKVGEVWLERGPDEVFEETVTLLKPDGGTVQQVRNKTLTIINIYWQDKPNSYRRISVGGLRHTNYIYALLGTVVTMGVDALEDPEESPFIIPLHDGIYKSVGMVDRTQMATACCNLVFNCYAIHKTKWYESDDFKFFLIFVIIVVSVVTAGTGTAPVVGFYSSIGVALGFTGAIAVIVGVAATTIAGMIIAKVMHEVSTELFGEKWGAIIGAVATIAAMAVGGAMLGGMEFSAAFGTLMRPDNLMMLTNAAVGSYTDYLASSAAEYQQQTFQVMQDYREKMTEINAAWEQLGAQSIFINPLRFTDSTKVVFAEPVSTFLQRTLMTGTDIANLSQAMIRNFSDITLSTKLSLT